MRQRAVVIALVALTAACGSQMTPEERERRDLQDVAEVEQANQALPPIEEVTPEPLLAPEIERYDLTGPGCSYAPGTSLGARAIAREADAFVKIGGAVERFAADAGARELPERTRSLYTGRNYELRLQISGEGTLNPSGRTNYEGTITLRDKHGRVVYSGTGLAQCGPA